MPEPEYVPDSATTAQESVYRSRSFISDGTYNREDILEHEKTLEETPPLDQRDVSPAYKHGKAAGDKKTKEEDSADAHKDCQPAKAREIWKFRMRPADDDQAQ